MPCQAGAGCSGDPGDCLERGLVADAVGGQAQARAEHFFYPFLDRPLASGAAAQIGSGRGRFDGVEVTHGYLAGSRLDEALGFGWCAYFPQLANPHFTAIASTSMRNSGRASRAAPISVSAGLWSPNSSTLACSMTGRYSDL